VFREIESVINPVHITDISIKMSGLHSKVQSINRHVLLQDNGFAWDCVITSQAHFQRGTTFEKTHAALLITTTTRTLNSDLTMPGQGGKSIVAVSYCGEDRFPSFQEDNKSADDSKESKDNPFIPQQARKRVHTVIAIVFPYVELRTHK
jgi:hypothetical protein